MSTNKPTLDVASARKIARGQISIVVDKTAERIKSVSAKFPSKRGAWLRAVENEFRDAYKETLLTIISEKRRVVTVYFLPLAEQYEGWLAIEFNMASFGGGTRNIKISAISENAIVRIMQGLRDCSPLCSSNRPRHTTPPESASVGWAERSEAQHQQLIKARLTEA